MAVTQRVGAHGLGVAGDAGGFGVGAGLQAYQQH